MAPSDYEFPFKALADQIAKEQDAGELAKLVLELRVLLDAIEKRVSELNLGKLPFSD